MFKRVLMSCLLCITHIRIKPEHDTICATPTFKVLLKEHMRGVLIGYLIACFISIPLRAVGGTTRTQFKNILKSELKSRLVKNVSCCLFVMLQFCTSGLQLL